MWAAPQAFLCTVKDFAACYFLLPFPKKHTRKKFLFKLKRRVLRVSYLNSPPISWTDGLERVLTRRGSSRAGCGVKNSLQTQIQKGPLCSLILPSWMSAHVLMVFEVWGMSSQHEVFSCVIAFLFHNLDKALSPSLIIYTMCYEMRPCLTDISPKVTLQSWFTFKNHCWEASFFRLTAGVHFITSSYSRSPTNTLHP